MPGSASVYYGSYPLWLEWATGGLPSSDSLSVHLSTDSSVMTPADNFGSYTEPSSSIGYVPVSSPEFSVNEADGNATASVDVSWSLANPGGHHETTTIYGWWLQDDNAEIYLAGGPISPPAKVVSSSTVNIAIDSITLTLGSCSTGGASYNVVFLETWQGSGNATLHSPDVGTGTWIETGLPGDSWSVGLGAVQSSNSFAGVTASQIQFNVGVSDGTITFNMMCPTALPLVEAGLLYRCSDSINFFKAEYVSDTSTLVAGIYWQKTVAGVETNLGSLIGQQIGPRRLTVVLSGDDHSISFNGHLLFSGSDTFNATATRIGLWSYNQTQPLYGLVEVDTP